MKATGRIMKEIPPLRMFVEDDGLLVVARGQDGLWRSLDEDSRTSWTDAEVADAVVLVPQGDVVTAQKKGFLWEVLVNDEIVATPSTSYVGEVVFDRVFRAPGRRATVVCKNNDLSAVRLIHPDTKE